jgi:hypothetical protein
MEPTRNDREPSAAPDAGATSPRLSMYGGLSIAMFILTIVLFGYAWGTNSPQSKRHDESANIAMATLATSFIGLCLGIVGRVRNERSRGLAVTGILLNGAWLICGGILLAIGYVIFGGSRGTDWH